MSSTASTTSSESNVCCNIFNFTKKDLIRSGFYCTKLFDNILCCGCGWQSGDTKLTIRHINFIHKLQKPDCEMSKHVIENVNSYSRYKKSVLEIEQLMKDTFLLWKNPFPTVDEMVQAGFYYTGSDDAIACIACGIVLEQWRPEDVLLTEHRKASPHCELVNINAL